jgi:hypothetical protein
MTEIEQELWNYIDGSCTPQERMQIEQRMAADPLWADLYQELLLFDAGLSDLELEHPSMSFTRKVMNSISAEQVPAAVSINKRLIYGISAFFGVLFSVVFCVLLLSVNWSHEPDFVRADLSVPPALFNSLLRENYLTVFYLADVVLALYILDHFLRKRLLSKKL